MELAQSTVPEPALERSLVVPVYRGERTLALLAEEISPLTATERARRGGRVYRHQLARFGQGQLPPPRTT